MSGDLVLKDGYLEMLRSGYADARSVFSTSSSGNSGIASVVGDSTLASRVRDFYGGWDKKRQELIDAMETLQDAVVTVSESFEQVDAELRTSAESMP